MERTRKKVWNGQLLCVEHCLHEVNAESRVQNRIPKNIKCDDSEPRDRTYSFVHLCAMCDGALATAIFYGNSARL